VSKKEIERAERAEKGRVESARKSRDKAERADSNRKLRCPERCCQIHRVL
jgi:hypothetical protein